MARFRKDPGWLRRAQQAREAAERGQASRDAGPVSSLPVVDADDVVRVSADELEESS